MNPKIVFALFMGLLLGVVFLNIPPSLDILMPLYGASYIQISVLISAILWSHALIQVPAGMLVDRFGIGRSLMISLIFMAVGNLIPTAVPDMKIAIMGRVISGMGTGLSFLAALKLVALYAPQGRAGAYQAFFGGFFSIGSILAYLLIPEVIVWGWQWTYLVPGIFSILLIPFLLCLRLEPKTFGDITPLSITRIVRMPKGWVIGIYHALSYGSMINLGNWVPTLLTETRPESTVVQLAWGGVLVMLISGLGRLSGGFTLLRFPPVSVANGSIMILCFLFTGLFLVPIPGLVLTLALLSAWFASINFGAFFHLASKATSPDSLATFFGFINLLANLGAVLFTMMFGWVKDTTGSLSWGFGILAILSLIAFFFGRRVLKEESRE